MLLPTAGSLPSPLPTANPTHQTRRGPAPSCQLVASSSALPAHRSPLQAATAHWTLLRRCCRCTLERQTRSQTSNPKGLCSWVSTSASLTLVNCSKLLCFSPASSFSACLPGESRHFSFASILAYRLDRPPRYLLLFFSCSSANSRQPLPTLPIASHRPTPPPSYRSLLSFRRRTSPTLTWPWIFSCVSRNEVVCRMHSAPWQD